MRARPRSTGAATGSDGARRPMNWGRNLLYLAAMALVVTITSMFLAGMSLGNCGDSIDCHSRRDTAFPAALGGGAVALAYLIYRFIRDPRGRD